MTDLVRHVSEVHRRVASLAGEEYGGAGQGMEDPAEEWRSASGVVLSILSDPSVSNKIVFSMMGEIPFSQLVNTLLAADTLVHTWDLARGAGLDDRLDPELVSATYAFMEPADEALRRPGGFGPKLDPPAGSDEQARLLCFLGRKC